MRGDEQENTRSEHESSECDCNQHWPVSSRRSTRVSLKAPDTLGSALVDNPGIDPSLNLSFYLRRHITSVNIAQIPATVQITEANGI